MEHHYIERESRREKKETFVGGDGITFLYSRVRESAPWLFRALTGKRFSGWLSYVACDAAIGKKLTRPGHFLSRCGIDFRECLHHPSAFDTPRKVFERKIRYWDCRPMPKDPGAVLSPADSRVLFGSRCETSLFFVKDKFFDYKELLGEDKKTWLRAFVDGTYGIFRLTPDKYHYTHTPVAGKVVDFYEIPGGYHSCHPDAVVSLVTPYSKNRRIVTLFDTDVPDGTGAGLVAMIEVVAMMIGDIVQCYSETFYENPLPVGIGLRVRRGCPKSLFRPGSSTVILLFQQNRVRLADDLTANLAYPGTHNIYSHRFSQPLIETDVKVRSLVATGYRHLPSEEEHP